MSETDTVALTVKHKREAAVAAVTHRQLAKGETWLEKAKQADLNSYVAGRDVNLANQAKIKSLNMLRRPLHESHSSAVHRLSNTVASVYKSQLELKLATAEAAEKRQLVDALAKAIAAEEPDVAAEMSKTLDGEQSKLDTLETKASDLQKQIPELRAKITRLEREAATALAAFDSALGVS